MSFDWLKIIKFLSRTRVIEMETSEFNYIGTPDTSTLSG